MWWMERRCGSDDTSREAECGDEDIGEENDGNEGVDVGSQIAGGCELLGDERYVPEPIAKIDVEAVEDCAGCDADKESDSDVAEVVDAEVETGEGGSGAPEVEDDGHATAAEEPGKKGGHTEGVAGMP